MAGNSEPQDGARLTVDEASALGLRALQQVGYSVAESRVIAAHLIDSELCGYPALGLARILTIAEHPRTREPRRDIRIVHETPMPEVGDELHHFGWNRCSSACHGPDRSHLIVPGFRSSRINIVNVADDPRRPYVEKVIGPEELIVNPGYTRPHPVQCMPGDNIVVSMLGDSDGGPF